MRPGQNPMTLLCDNLATSLLRSGLRYPLRPREGPERLNKYPRFTYMCLSNPSQGRRGNLRPLLSKLVARLRLRSVIRFCPGWLQQQTDGPLKLPPVGDSYGVTPSICRCWNQVLRFIPAKDQVIICRIAEFPPPAIDRHFQNFTEGPERAPSIVPKAFFGAYSTLYDTLAWYVCL